MERAGKLLAQSKLAARCATPEHLALASWPAAVGKKIAAHTKATALIRNRLVVEVEDIVWQRQLHPLTAQIITRFDKLLGNAIVGDIEFRVVAQRRQPERAEVIVRTMDAADLAERIADPILDRIYRAAKLKALKRASA